MTPEITVCIVHWNTPDDLRSCTEALLASSTASITEIIVVDNDSKPDAIDAFQRDFPGISHIRITADVGYAAGCNQASTRMHVLSHPQWPLSLLQFLHTRSLWLRRDWSGRMDARNRQSQVYRIRWQHYSKCRCSRGCIVV